MINCFHINRYLSIYTIMMCKDIKRPEMPSQVMPQLSSASSKQYKEVLRSFSGKLLSVVHTLQPPSCRKKKIYHFFIVCDV